MRKHRNYQDEILAAVQFGEIVDSDVIAERVGIARNYLLQDLYQLSLEGRLVREQVSRVRGGVSYLYHRPVVVPWSEWPSWTCMTDLPFAFVR